MYKNLDNNLYFKANKIYLFEYNLRGLYFFYERNYKMNYGYQNEYDFVELFNSKYLYELDDNSQKFLKDLFGETMDNNEII